MNILFLILCTIQLCNLPQSSKDPIKLDYKLYYKADNIDTPVVYLEESLYTKYDKYVTTKLLKSGKNIFKETEDENGSFKISIIPTKLYKLYYNNKNNYLEAHQPLLLMSDDFYDIYAIEDTITNLRWSITNKTKLIDSFNCFLAQTTYRCKKYFAWFTPKIPYNTGPWKLHGLPGLILEAYDENKVRHYKLEKITPNYTETDIIDKFLNDDIKDRIPINNVSKFYSKLEKSLLTKNTINNLDPNCSDCPRKVVSKRRINTWECY